MLPFYKIHGQHIVPRVAHVGRKDQRHEGRIGMEDAFGAIEIRAIDAVEPASSPHYECIERRQQSTYYVIMDSRGYTVDFGRHDLLASDVNTLSSIERSQLL